MQCVKATGSILESFSGKNWNSAERFLAEVDFSKKGNGLNYDDFHAICTALFQPNEIKENEWRIREVFNLFDSDHDNLLREQEWNLFSNWIRVIVEPVNVLLIVDVQNDFIDGTLALRNCGCGQDGAEVIDPINRLIRECSFDKVIYSLDWHPENHISFYENLHLRELHSESKISKENAEPFDVVLFSKPRLEQKLWPRHCVMNTWGAQLHKDLVIAPNSVQVRKGQNLEMEAYSVFSDNNTEDSKELENILSEMQATHLFVCGLAYDVCVRATSLDGLQLQYPLAIIDDCCRGIDPDNVKSAKTLIQQQGGLIINSDNVMSLINDGKRSLIMSHQCAKRLTCSPSGNNVMFNSQNRISNDI